MRFFFVIRFNDKFLRSIYAVVFGGVVLALAIAFGLGGRDAAKGYIDNMLQEKSEEDDDISHI